MSTEKKKEQQLLEDVAAQPAVQSSYSTAGLNSRKEVENALTNAAYTPGQSVTDAAADLKNWQQNRPGKYESAYQGRIEDLIGQLLERNSFQYSYAQDPLYRQYAQQYTQNARNASADAAAQAAALTGGYGSSYGQAVGQQQYNAYMQQLAAVMPELYDRARSAYDAEGNRMLQEYELTGDLARDDYSKYQDAYNRWLAERSYAQGNADTAYDRGYNQWLQELNQRNKDSLRRVYGSTTRIWQNRNGSTMHHWPAGLPRAAALGAMNQKRKRRNMDPAFLRREMWLE